MLVKYLITIKQQHKPAEAASCARTDEFCCTSCDIYAQCFWGQHLQVHQDYSKDITLKFHPRLSFLFSTCFHCVFGSKRPLLTLKSCPRGEVNMPAAFQ